MLELLKEKLDTYEIFKPELPNAIAEIMKVIPYHNVPDKMKALIAASEIILFTSQFRRNIQHWNGTQVPINSISFVIAGSGQNKDSSVSAARRCFEPGYAIINEKREEFAKQKAIELAIEAGVDSPYSWQEYKPFYDSPKPLFVAPSTTEGFIQHLNDIDSAKLGAGFMYTGEFGAELATSPVFVDNLKLIAEIYDIGNKEVKLVKNKEGQSKEIKGLPVSALFVGSPINILYDETIKAKFKLEFSSKLARRSWFCFILKNVPDVVYDSIEDLLLYEETIENNATQARESLADAIKYMTYHNLNKAGLPIEVSLEARKLFTMYKRYNSEVAENLPKLYPIAALVRKHLQWKALKLAGALAIIYEHDTIELSDYVEAIRFAEMLDVDMQQFENELVKEPYEIFVDYMQSIATDGKAFLSIHNLRKLGFISLSLGKYETKLKDLCHLAASYDPTGIYKITPQGIEYEAIKIVSTFSMSIKPIDNSDVFEALKENNNVKLRNAKQVIATRSNAGLEEIECEFIDLVELLKNDYAYSPFRFKNGIRNKETLLPGTKLLVFDIDDSTITAEEAHFILEDINHHIALTADPTKHFKFRVILELDSVVDISPIVWKYFYKEVATSLSLNVDLLPQSQLFFSYSTSPVWSVTDAKPLAVRDYLMIANDKALETPTISKPLTTAQVALALSDPFTTFRYAYDCAEDGSGSRKLMRAAYHARDLGMPKEDIIELMRNITDYWVNGFPLDRLENKIISQIRRFK